jgi:hypothetical protein
MISSLLPPPTAHARARHRGLFWLAALLLAVALVGGVFVAVTSYLDGSQPGSVVAAYFAALRRGDAAKALSYGQVPAGSHAYLSAAVLREQLTIAPLDAVDVQAVDQQGRAASVSVMYQFHYHGTAVTVDDTVPMVRHGRQWRLSQSAVVTRVGLAQAANRARFADAAFPATAVAVFPGLFPITFDTPNLQVAPGQAAARFAHADDSALAVTLSPSGKAAVGASVNHALQACLSGDAGTPAAALCPVPGGAGIRAVPGSLRGTIVSQGATPLILAVANDPDGAVAISGTVTVNGSYQALAYDNTASSKSGKVDVTISAQCYAGSVGAVTWGTP